MKRPIEKYDFLALGKTEKAARTARKEFPARWCATSCSYPLAISPALKTNADQDAIMESALIISAK